MTNEVENPEWTCPECGNRFSYLDGTRTLTHSQSCKCSGMPLPITLMRALRGYRREDHFPAAPPLLPPSREKRLERLLEDIERLASRPSRGLI